MLTLQKRMQAVDPRRLFCILVMSLVLAVSLARYGFIYDSMLAFTLLLTPLACMAGGITLFESGVRKGREFRILLAFFLWTVLCVLVNERRGESLLSNQADLSSLLITLLVCFPLAAFLGREPAERFLRRAAVVTLIVIVLFDAVGLAAAVLSRYSNLFFQSEYGIGIAPTTGRLHILCHPNSVGMIAIVGIGLSFYLLPACRRKLAKIGLLAGVACMYLATLIASARTSQLAILVCLGLLAFQAVWNCPRIASGLWRALLGLCAMAAVAGCLYGSSRYLVQGFNLLQDRLSPAAVSSQPSIEPAASPATAATPAPTATAVPDADAFVAVERAFTYDNGTLNGRTLIWQSAFTAIRQHPTILLCGVSPGLVGPIIDHYPNSTGSNLHNIFIQVLFSTGCPGLLLFLAFLVCLAQRCWRLFFSKDSYTPGQKRLPVILVGILVLSCMESFLLLYENVYFANVWFFLIAGWICAADSVRMQPSAA